MSVLYGVPLDAAYHLVSVLTGAFAPVLGGFAAVAGIVVFTMAVRLLIVPLSYRAMRGQAAQARLAPAVQALRQRYRRQPERMQRELASLYRSQGTSMYAGFLPLLAQWPFLSVVYLVFRSPRIGGHVNTLLTHDLFGVPLGMRWLGGPGPVSVQGAVFIGLFCVLAGIGALSARLARRAALPPELPAPRPRPAAPAATQEPGASPRPGGSPRSAASPRTGTAPRRDRPPQPAAPAKPAPGGVWLTRLMPFVTVVFAAFSPLAAGVYLATTTGWTVLERRLLRSALVPPQAQGQGQGQAQAQVQAPAGGRARPRRSAH